MNYAPLVRLSYNDMSGVIEVWASACDNFIAYEHEADESVKTTHVHILMMGCKYKTAEPMKRLYYRMFPNADSSDGNGLWSWVNKNHPVPDVGFIRYMSKGVLRPKFVKGFLPAVVEEQRLGWVEPSSAPLTQTFIPLPERPKITKHTLMLKVVNLILTEHTNSSEAERNAVLLDVEPDKWFKTIRKVLVEEKQMVGIYKVIDIYDSCVMYYQKEKFLNNCQSLLEKRYR